jgi:DNA polymerase III epsilon subunit-like protein
MGYDIRSRECKIERPSFIGDMDKVICFLDFRLNLYNIKNGGRIIEYSLIKCSRNNIEVFHSIARPSFSLTNDKVGIIEDVDIPIDVIEGSRNTFEVFLDMIEFLKDVDIVICHHWYHHIRILKYYLIELGIDIPKFWLWTVEYYVEYHYKELIGEFDSKNGFLRAYKCLLIYEVSECKRMKEKSYVDYARHGFWNSPDKKKIEAFYKKLKKFNKWLFADRRGRSPSPWLVPYYYKKVEDVQEAE